MIENYSPQKTQIEVSLPELDVMEEWGEEDVGHSDEDVVLNTVVERIRQTLSNLRVVNVL